MPARKPPTREEQIALMANAPARMAASAQAWLADPEMQASLHKYDRPTILHEQQRPAQRAYGR